MSDQEADVNDAKGTGPDGWKAEVQVLEVFEYPSIFAAAAEKYRQEGRDEVLLTIAELSWMSSDDLGNSWCHFCGEAWGVRQEHKPECLWVAAQAAVKRKAAR